MHADTDAIRNLAAANSAHADELAAIASKLASAPTSAPAFGPVGEPFLAALAEAVAHEARGVAALRDRASATGDAAYRTARAYDDADDRAGARVSGV
ncbi:MULTISPECIES: type VII secretion target [unclassified Mycobacterium]|uniref:type VII secretion target n=1 Tax=unclassified Mycobacterium TaxID=2642494 RepID=UPI0007401A19|nr:MULTISPECIES: type VII secretion target [unclassified Mycobacterium]KUH88157.1 hypothetical protein AU186_09610 [Mycobacterium sp. GA-1999]KUH89466.1 hypothetical protein AU185_14410 [Mycobacterium sp. GA-0227b]